MNDAPKLTALAPTAASRPDTALLLITVGRECQRRVRTALAERDLKPQQVRILDVLAQQGPVGQRELGEILGVDHSLLVTLLNPLETDGLIQRRRDDQDRRRHHVSVTDSGQQLLKEALAVIQTVQAELLRPLADGSQDQLQHLLQTVQDESRRWPGQHEGCVAPETRSGLCESQESVS